jgi:hypothetical protein
MSERFKSGVMGLFSVCIIVLLLVAMYYPSNYAEGQVINKKDRGVSNTINLTMDADSRYIIMVDTGKNVILAGCNKEDFNRVKINDTVLLEGAMFGTWRLNKIKQSDEYSQEGG